MNLKDTTLASTPAPTRAATITVFGAGVLGLWQALMLARAGHSVRLVEASAHLGANAASRWGGVMLAPDCESDTAPASVRDHAFRGLTLWRELWPSLAAHGTLVVALPRDRAELERFAGRTRHYEWVDATHIAALEPELAGRFDVGLYYPREAHLTADDGMRFLMAQCEMAGVAIDFGETGMASPKDAASAGWIIDCRGYGARHDMPDLRGVRGERILVHAPGLHLSRPIRLLHPRQPVYVVPQGDGGFVIGATVVERDDAGPVTVRSTLDLLGAAQALLPALGEAAVMDLGAGVRPTFPDHAPRVRVEVGGGVVRVNGAYRHGFLLAPVLAETVRAYLNEAGPGLPFLEIIS